MHSTGEKPFLSSAAVKKLLRILGISTLHFIVSTALSVYAFTVSMSYFESGTADTASLGALKLASEVLQFPVRLVIDNMPNELLREMFPGLKGHILFFLNSLLWGVVLFHGMAFIRAAFRPRG
jgi:hypothetical protein